MTTEREQILALAGAPLYQVCKSDSVSLSAAWIDVDAQTYQDAGLYAEYGRRVLYTADQVIAARKPLEEEIEALTEERALNVRQCDANQELVTEPRQQLAVYEANAHRFIAADKAMQQQLVAAQADNERLLSVLCEIAGSKSLTATPTQFYQHLQRVASDGTMSPPSDTSALESLVKQAGEVMRERTVAAISWINPEAWNNPVAVAQTEIRTLPGVTMEDLK